MEGIKNLANWKLISPLFVLFAVFAFYLFPHYGEQLNNLTGDEVVILDSRQTYTAEEVAVFFQGLGVEGRALYYFVSSKIDMVYPIIYGSLFFLIIVTLAKRLKHPKWIWLSIAVILAPLFDYLENISIQNLLKNYPNITESNVTFAANMTAGKWFFVLLTLIAIIVLALVNLMAALRTKDVV